MEQHDQPAGAGCERQLRHLWESTRVSAIGVGEAAGGIAGFRPRMVMQQEYLCRLSDQHSGTGWCGCSLPVLVLLPDSFLAGTLWNLALRSDDPDMLQ